MCAFWCPFAPPHHIACLELNIIMQAMNKGLLSKGRAAMQVKYRISNIIT
jgi:hypothetical protein